jgi:hypothetical protein
MDFSKIKNKDFAIAGIIFVLIMIFLYREYKKENFGYSMGTLNQLVAKDQQDRYLTE